MLFFYSLSLKGLSVLMIVTFSYLRFVIKKEPTENFENTGCIYGFKY